MPRYEHGRGKKATFWTATLKGKQLFVQFGSIGKAGQTRLKQFASSAAAKTAMAEAIAKKLTEGFVAVERPGVTEKPALPPAKRTALLAIARELGGSVVEREVAMAIDTPEAYLDRFAETYETIEDASHAEVPWLGMIECMTERKAIVEVDWKQEGRDVLAWLEVIGGSAAKRALEAAHEPSLDDRPTEEALALFGRMLGAAKLALIQLDKSSDSYALAVVPAARVAPFAKLARTAGESICHHDGKDLEQLVKDRERENTKQNAPKDPWKALVAEHAHSQTGSQVDSALWGLLHGRPTVDRVRAAAEFAPKRDRPLIDMTLAIYDGSASKLAKTTKQPELLLTALRYLEATPPERRYERLAAAATLAERLKIAPDRGKRHRAVCAACNLWSYDKTTDAQLARLPAPARERLARLGDAMLGRSIEGAGNWSTAIRMLSVCGDDKSLPLLEDAGRRSIVDREKNDYDMSGPYAWETTAAHIRRRIGPKRKR